MSRDSGEVLVVRPGGPKATSHGPLAHPVTQEKDLPRASLLVAVGIGIGIAFGIEIAIGRHFDIDSDSDPDTAPGISRYQLYYRSRGRETVVPG